MRWQHKCDRHPSPGGALVRIDGQWRSFGEWFKECPHCKKPNPYHKKKEPRHE